MSEAGIVKYDTEYGEVKLSPKTVRDYLVSGEGRVTDQEVMMFIAMCKFQKLNPFLREAYLIKYGDRGPATMVTGKEVFTKRAARNPLYDGTEAGITVKLEGGAIERREGALLLDGEQLIAGWARVYLKNQRVPVFAEASFKEYARRKKDGSLTQTWAAMPSTMIRKVALVQALREAFPEDFAGLYSQEEMPTSGMELPTAAVEVKAEEQSPEPEPEVLVAEVVEDTAGGEIDIELAKTITFPAGRHKDKLLWEVATEDPGYMDWYLRSGKDDVLKAAILVIADYMDEQERESVEDEDDTTCPQCDGTGTGKHGGQCVWCDGTGHVE